MHTVFGCVCFRNERDQCSVVEVGNIGKGVVLLRARVSKVCGLRTIKIRRPCIGSPAQPDAKEPEIAHQCGTGHRVWGSGTTETEVADWRLGIRDTQEFVYSIRRNSFERRIAKTDEGTGVFGRNRTELHEGGDLRDECAEQHPWGCREK